MPRFQYKAYTETGEVTKGDITAQSVTEAIERLYQQNLIPFATSEVSEHHQQQSIWTRQLTFGKSVRLSTLAAFTRELATLAGANLPLDEVLRILCVSDNKAVKSIASPLLQRVLAGDALSEAMAREAKVFPPYYMGMVKAAETAGALEQTFEDLAGYLERQVEVRAKIGSSLIYPFILLGMAVTTLVIIIAILIPQLVSLFESTGKPPPLVLQVFQYAGDVLEANWLTFLIGTLAICTLAALLLRDRRVRLALDRLKLNNRVFGPIVSGLEAARFARTLGSLLRSGASILSALDNLLGVSRNRVVRNATRDAIRQVREGADLHTSLSESRVFPLLAVRLVEIGERSGRLEEMLLHAANIFEKQSQRKIERLMGLLTPTLTLLIGLGVGALMMSIMSAILSINDLAF